MDGKISFETVEDFQMNQSRLHTALLPEQKDDVDPNTISPPGSRRSGASGAGSQRWQGRLVSLNGPRAPRDIVLPDNYAVCGPRLAKDVPGRL